MLDTLTRPTNPREILAAAPDVMRAALGIPSPAPHPLAATLSLVDVAMTIGRSLRPQRADEPDRAVVARGMASTDFGKLTADGGNIIIKRTYPSAAAGHLAFAAVIPIPDFRPVDIVGIDADAVALAEESPAGELQVGSINTPAGAAQARLATFGRVVVVSRQAILDGALQPLELVAAGAAVNGARLEARLIADALEANANLDDGQPVFDAAFGNIVAQALDETTLGEALRALRQQRTASGEYADLPLRHIVCEPALELKARRLVHEGGLTGQVDVHALSKLPAGRWYAVADPVLAPCVGLLRLRGSEVPVTMEATKAGFEVDGLGLKVLADAGAAMVGRVGIVRGGLVEGD